MSSPEKQRKRSFGKSMAVATGIGAGMGYATGMAFVGYLHREKSHNAIKFSKPLEMAARIAVWSYGVKARSWAAMHRDHHEHSDTALDPHSPANSSVLNVWLRNQKMAKEGAKAKTDDVLPSDLQPDKLDKALFDKRKLGVVAGIAGHMAVNKLVGNNSLWGLYSYGVSALVTAKVQDTVNSLGHAGQNPREALLTGKITPYPDETITSDFGFGWLLLGEPNQRYHHDHPEEIVFAGGSLANQLRRDTFGVVIKAMAEYTPLAEVGTGPPPPHNDPNLS